MLGRIGKWSPRFSSFAAHTIRVSTGPGPTVVNQLLL